MAEFRSEFGLSLFMAFKAISARQSELKEASSSWEETGVLTPFLSPRRQVIAVAFEDSVDEDRDYFKVRRTYLGFVRDKQLDPDDAAIIADVLSPWESHGFEPSQKLQAYSRWSLIDSTAYLFRLQQRCRASDQPRVAQAVRSSIPAPVLNAWERAFAEIDEAALQALVGNKDQFFERTLFTHLPAWCEYHTLQDYRLRVEEAAGQRLNDDFPVTHPAARKFAEPKANIADLLGVSNGVANLQGCDTRTCGAFHRTIALVASVEQSEALKIEDGEKLLDLLDQTVDVAAMLSLSELRAFIPPRRNDALYEYLRTAVMHDAKPSKVSNHAVRRALQRLARERFGDDLVKLVEYLDTSNGHVSEHLYYLCTEAFLTELYDLYEKTDDVTEAQAQVLEWRGRRFDDANATGRAKSHRLNLRLRKVRGAIEETRIYVDPLRFMQWMQDEVGSDMRALLNFADEIAADTDKSLSLRDPVQTAVQPRLRLLKVLDECFAEFCQNKIYGVNAFIGRRIRHGTLHGHLVTETWPQVERSINKFETIAPSFSSFLRDWFEEFDAAVRYMADERMHVRDEGKKSGLIRATVDSHEKGHITAKMLRDVSDSMVAQRPLGHRLALIHDFCWILLGVDLEKARSEFEGIRRQFTIDVNQFRTPQNADLDQKIMAEIRELNSCLQHKFEVVRSWLTRPTNVSPSASISLLFEAVMNEVQQRITDFKPKLDITGSSTVDLIGHRFHYFYDALFILVGNAARHGMKQGVLGFHVESDFTQSDFNYVSVSISSEFIPGTREQRIAGIEKEMNADIGDAVGKNVGSGLRKLRGIVEDVEEIVSLHHRYEGESVVFTLDMRYQKR